MTPTLEQAWTLLANGNTGRALNIARTLLKSENSPETLYLIGRCQKNLKQYRYAAVNIQNALKQNPYLSGANVALADCLFEIGNTGLAAEQYQIALSKKLDLGAAHYGLGRLVPDNEDALKHFQQAIKHEPDNPKFLTTLGTRLFLQDKVEEGHALYQHALHIKPDYYPAICGMALMYARDRKFDKAMEQVNILIKQEIYDGNAAIAYLLSSKHVNSCDEALNYAEISLTSPPPQPKRSVHIQMAHVLDYQKKYDEAWKHIVEAKKLTVHAEFYDTAIHKVGIDNIINAFTPAELLKLPKANIENTDCPIFILGMPRSGTSLVEQILSSHPEVHGAGELTYMGDIVKAISSVIHSNKPWPACIGEITQGDLNKLSAQYLANLPETSGSVIHITDKMPHNFLAIGLIRLLFPDAAIIHCKRHELDTCLSIYFQDFETGHSYANDLFHLGTHYFQYLRMMKHWKSVYADKIFDINYENLVTNPEDSTRSLLEFCNLSWHEDCLNFNKRKSVVRTASFDQVRQPLYTKSIDRWKNYEQYLDELKSGLERGL